MDTTAFRHQQPKSGTRANRAYQATNALRARRPSEQPSVKADRWRRYRERLKAAQHPWRTLTADEVSRILTARKAHEQMQLTVMKVPLELLSLDFFSTASPHERDN